MITYPGVVLAIALLAARDAAAALPSFLGCVSASALASTTGVTQVSRSACQDYCLTQSLNRHGAAYIVNTAMCYCVASEDSLYNGPPVASIVEGTDSQGNCQPYDASYDVQVLQSRVDDAASRGQAPYAQFVGCFTTRPPAGPNGDKRLSRAARANFVPYYTELGGDRSYAYYLTPTGNQAGFEYFVYRDGRLDVSSLTPTNCGVPGPNTWLVATGSAIVSPSGAQRRAGRAKRERSLCPSEQRACRIYGSAEYECLSTDYDFESCGGCRYGEFTGSYERPHLINSTSGEDCSSIAGAEPWGISCSMGRCDVKACLEGFILVDGRCERIDQ